MGWPNMRSSYSSKTEYVLFNENSVDQGVILFGKAKI